MFERKCHQLGIEEVTHLSPGLDFRLPQYRREVFLRFYEFHSKYNSHPGGVYYAMPWIFETHGTNIEEKLWYCYINGLCQNIITTHRICNIYPFYRVKSSVLFRDSLFFWFRQNYGSLGWDTDRRYVKNKFESCVNNYLSLIGEGSQEEYFNLSPNKFTNFDLVWDKVINNFSLFGRLSTFSYLEYLRIAGVNIECSNLFLEDINGSKSHRNGLCKVLGLDEWDWHDKINPSFGGRYTPEMIYYLQTEALLLFRETQMRVEEATLFTLESTLCCYKSWHRPNRRYPNVYNDMFYDRILYNEKATGERNEMFREIRFQRLPKELRIEDNPGDPGLKPEKQNHYLNTGQVIMMDKMWDCFRNDFDKKVSIRNTIKQVHESLHDDRHMWDR